MTRRRFTRALAGTAFALWAGLSWAARQVAPRRMVWAVRLERYPGQVVPMTDITRQSKWGG